MTVIASVSAREILDSRGQPTIEVDVVLDSGAWGRSAAPAGASTGEREAVELRDGEAAFGGRGVSRAVAAVDREIAPALNGLDASDQERVDERLVELDGTPNKSRLGGNAIVAVSVATARAAAEDAGMPLYRWLARGRAEMVLPVPQLNVINGGAHAPNALDVQEFMLVPAGAESFRQAMRMASETYHELRRVLAGRGLVTSVGDEGGFAPDLGSTEQAREAIVEAIIGAGYEGEIVIGLDPAASGFHRDRSYVLAGEGRTLDAGEMIGFYDDLARRYPIVMIEDGLAENDWDGWRQMTQELGSRIQLVGDDIFVTNRDLLAQGIESDVANAVLIKLNQVGTVSETLATIDLAQRSGYGTMISHRSGETEDTTIADLAVATAAGQIKSGAPARGERIAKYNRLLRIEEELGSSARFAGWQPFARFRS
jgi:enolase